MEIAEGTCVIVVILCHISSVTSQSAGCNPGWFGPNCRYKCRCASNDCDQVSGQCPGTCQGGWFGPACQYVDLAYRRSQTIQLSDGLDDTCNTNSRTRETVAFDKAYFFTWLRIHVSSPDALKQNLTITFNASNTSCVNQRTAIVNERTLDIYCHLDSPVTSVTVTGDVVLSLCSIYVSGGRNVALKETATQSSTYVEKSIYYTADKAVDGNINPVFYGGKTCAHTLAGQPSPNTWKVTFSQPREVNRYVIYNRQEASYRLVGFNIQSFDAAKNLVFNYTDRQGDIPVYTVTHEGQRLQLVHITTASKDKCLQICEVELYGDSACGPGKYGRECEHTCNCAGGEPCFVSTGGCPSGCAAGFQGENCSIPCAFGTFGPGCLAECSDLCVTVAQYMILCDRFNGTCLLGCKPGYQGDLCTEHSSYAEPSGNGQRTAIIVGCVLGAVILIIIVTVVIFVFRHQRSCHSLSKRNPPPATFRSGTCNPGAGENKGNESGACVACTIHEIPETSKETKQKNIEVTCAGYQTYDDPVADDHPYDDIKENNKKNSPFSWNDLEYMNAGL